MGKETGEQYHDGFILNGRIPAKSNLFQNWRNLYTSGTGIYEGVNTVLGEQLIVPNDKARAPIYKRFQGPPMKAGDAWMERIVLKVPSPTHFTGKEGAKEALDWYDSTFYETVHRLDYSGTRSVSLSDRLLINQVNMSDSGAINDVIVDRMSQDIQRELEHMAGTLLVTQMTNSITMDLSTPEKIREAINEYAIDMKSTNAFAEVHKKTDGSLYAENVVAIVSAKTAYKLTQQPAVYPNAGVIRTEAEILPVYGTMPSGISAEEYKEPSGSGYNYIYYKPGTDMTKDANKADPPGLNRPSPDVILLDEKYLEIRPYLEGWSLDTNRNAKGRFNNVHASYVGAMGIKPWRSAVCLYNKTAAATAE